VVDHTAVAAGGHFPVPGEFEVVIFRIGNDVVAIGICCCAEADERAIFDCPVFIVPVLLKPCQPLKVFPSNKGIALELLIFLDSLQDKRVIANTKRSVGFIIFVFDF